LRDLFGVEIAAPYVGHNEVSFNFGTVLSRVPGLSRRKGADLKVPNTYAAHVCLYKYSASRKNKRHLLDRHAGFDTVTAIFNAWSSKAISNFRKLAVSYPSSFPNSTVAGSF